MRKLEKTGKMRLVAVDSYSVVHHHHQQQVEQQTIIEEIDFFNDQKPRKLLFLPQKKGHAVEILFPEILLKRARVDDQEYSENDHNILKKRKFEVQVVGLNMIINDDYYKQENPNNITTPLFLFEKKLEKSDVSKGLCRLFVTQNDKLLEALTEEEKRAVLDEEGIRVSTVDEEGRVYELFLKRWTSLKMFVFNHHWRKLYSANGLKKGDIVRAWGYRHNSEFCMVMSFIRNNHE